MKRTLLIGMLLGALIGSWVLWMPVVVRAVACTPLGTTTAILGLCKPATGELSWGTAVNANYDAIDVLNYVPSGAILMINSGSCPTGYTEVTALRGRYPVGVPSGGTMAASVGTALTNSENRPAGAHTHGYNDVANATVQATGATTQVNGVYGTDQTDNGGLVAGTNAPYYQLMFCKKT